MELKNTEFVQHQAHESQSDLVRDMFIRSHFSEHWTDKDGNPGGGISSNRGATISWQNGPLGRVGTDERKEPNGAFVEDIIEMVISRLEFYQTASDGKFACRENAQTIELLNAALEVQRRRTEKRTAAGIEGTNEMGVPE